MQMKLLTDVELEMMNILWKSGEGSVHHVIDQLPKDRKLAYTSVSTMLRILEDKKIIGSRKEGRGHIYFPLIEKTDYEVKSAKTLVSNVFEGAPSNLIRCLINFDDISASELKEIQSLVSKKLK